MFQLADHCGTDTALSIEASEIWNRLQSEDASDYPNAHACRLKLYLTALESDYPGK